MAETPKRLEPKKDTIREIFAKSGNQCAFPGCHRPLIDDNGNFVAQVCHIEAAESGGERFNLNMSNEDRRSSNNLLLMCYEHHVVTNDVNEYPVPRMNDIKAQHEAKYANAVDKIWSSLTDEVTTQQFVASATLQRMNEVLGWNLSNEQLQASIPEMVEIQGNIRKLPPRTRELLVSIIIRAEVDWTHEGVAKAPQFEIMTACDINYQELMDHINILKRYGVGGAYDEEYEAPAVVLYHPESNWEIWTDIRKYCEDTGISLSEIIVDLKFHLLD